MKVFYMAGRMGYTISLYHEHQNSFFQRIMCRPLLRIGVFFAADAREVYPLNGSWDFSFNGKPAEKVTVPHTWNAEDAANGAQGKREDAKSVNSDAYRRGPAFIRARFQWSPGRARGISSAAGEPALFPKFPSMGSLPAAMRGRLRLSVMK